MRQSFALRWRQVHLDFHTGPWIKDVGTEFDACDFAKTMKTAHVNSVTVFAKCHHGHLYYNTQRPERHPGLKRGLDLLGMQVEALHREGIRAPIYISVQCDEHAADTHPEWIAREADGKPVGAGPLLTVDAPTTLEATVLRQNNRTIVHLLHYVPERRTATLDIVEDIVPLFDVPVSVKLPKAPKKVYLAPEKTPIPFEHRRGRTDLRVPEVRGHAMVVFE